MLFYGKYENGKRYICAYDEKKNGLRQVGKIFFLYNNAVVCRAVYNTEAEAVASFENSQFIQYNGDLSGWYDIAFSPDIIPLVIVKR